MLSRKEKEKKLLDALNLKVGDKVKLLDNDIIYEIIDTCYRYELKPISNGFISRYMFALLNYNYEHVKVGKVGDTLCCDYASCSDCPLRAFSYCECARNSTLFENIKGLKKEEPEIYDFIIDRLNKAVEI